MARSLRGTAERAVACFVILLLSASRADPAGVVLTAGTDTSALLPLPFSRVLRLASPPLIGADVDILQHLLRRSTTGGCNASAPAPSTGAYDAATVLAVQCFQRSVVSQQTLHSYRQRGDRVPSPHSPPSPPSPPSSPPSLAPLPPDGVVGPLTAMAVLRILADDDWVDDGRSAASMGYKYKVLLPVHRNRSVETTATLLDAHNNVLLTFPARAHGYDVDAAGQRVDGIAWPDLTDDGCPLAAARQGCVGLNMFSPDGATPTGLSEIDLNTPETPASSERFYGPFPVNRFVRRREKREESLFCNVIPSR